MIPIDTCFDGLIFVRLPAVVLVYGCINGVSFHAVNTVSRRPLRGVPLAAVSDDLGVLVAKPPAPFIRIVDVEFEGCVRYLRSFLISIR